MLSTALCEPRPQSSAEMMFVMFSRSAYSVLFGALVVLGVFGCAAAPAGGDPVVEPNFGSLTESMKSSGDVKFDGYRSGHLLADEGFHLFAFEGRGGSAVTVQLLENSISPKLVPNLFLVGPIDDGGFPEVGRALMDDGEMNISAELPSSGQYLVAVGAQRGHGIYTLALWCESDNCDMPPLVD